MSILAINGGQPLCGDELTIRQRAGASERENLLDMLDSGKWWRADGQWTRKLERMFARWHGARYGLAVTNGTHAPKLSLAAAGLTSVFSFGSSKRMASGESGALLTDRRSVFDRAKLLSDLVRVNDRHVSGGGVVRPDGSA